MSGRPSTYTPEVAAIICERISNGASVRTLCADEGMPAPATIYKWLSQHTEFSEQYAKAREEQADNMADEIISLADEQPPTIRDREGEAVGVRMDSAFVAWQRLRIDSRKWVASKLKPKKYGEKVLQEVTGADGGAIQAKVTVEFVGSAPGSVSLPVAAQS
jgi:transposase-like protein